MIFIYKSATTLSSLQYIERTCTECRRIIHVQSTIELQNKYMYQSKYVYIKILKILVVVINYNVCTKLFTFHNRNRRHRQNIGIIERRTT